MIHVFADPLIPIWIVNCFLEKPSGIAKLQIKSLEHIYVSRCSDVCTVLLSARGFSYRLGRESESGIVVVEALT